ncbi:MAG: NAD(P)H-dependent oxidoreductase subunit E [Ignavibacteria bacterium]|nr:NAD(P)H-dependent oxidoreductase subunit E [Ignavibacteria bacterium]
MTHSFSTEELSEITKLKSQYPDAKAAIMPVLWMAQKKWEWLSEDVLRTVATVMELPYAHVLGVASFYTMYYKKPMGRHHVQVCTNVSCMLRGGAELYADVKGKLGVGHNQTTADGKYSLEEVECMGACGGAPMIAINEQFFENVNSAKVMTLIDACE